MRGFYIRALGIAVVTAMLHGGAVAAESTLLPSLSDVSFNKDTASQVMLASEFSRSATYVPVANMAGPPRARILTRQEASLSVPLGSAVMLDLAYNANMGGRAGIFDAKAVKGSNGLFFSGGALNSPYASVVNGASYAGVSLAVSDDVKLRVGAASLSPGRNTHLNDPASTLLALDGNLPGYETRRAKALMAGLNWSFAEWGGLGVVAIQTNERSIFSNNTVFNNSTNSVGLSAHVAFADGWVTTASFSTSLSARTQTQFDSPSKAYGLAIAKHGLFGTDSSLGLSVSRPLRNDWTSGLDARPIFFGRANLLENIQETDIEVGYVTSFMDGALALQTNAAYQVNGGQNGNDSVSLLSRAKIKF